MTLETSRCPYCGAWHLEVLCPRVAEIDYHQNGTVKRVRLHGWETDVPTPLIPLPLSPSRGTSE